MSFKGIDAKGMRGSWTSSAVSLADAIVVVYGGFNLNEVSVKESILVNKPFVIYLMISIIPEIAFVSLKFKIREIENFTP